MKKLVLVFLCSVLAISAHAQDIEKEQLARILAELDRVAYMSMRANQVQDESTRSHFDFEQLHHDLGQIKKGIHAYLAGMPMQASLIEPLDDDYLEMRRWQ